MSELTKLEHTVESAQTPFEKIEALNTLAWAIHNTNFHRSQFLVEEALRLYDCHATPDGQQHNWLLQRASSLLMLATCNGQTKNFHLSLSQAEAALDIYNQTADKKGQASALNVIGIMYYHLADYKQALFCYDKSLLLHQDIGHLKGQAKAILNIGTVYSYLGDYAKALHHYLKGLALYEDIGDLHGQLLSLINIGAVYCELDDFEKAMQDLTKSLTIAEQIGDQYSQAYSHQNIGDVHYKLGDYEKAMTHLSKSLAISGTFGDQYMQATAHHAIGNVYYQQADYDKVLDNLTHSLFLFEEIANRHGQVHSHLSFGRTFAKLRRFDEAETHLQKALGICDELGLKKERYNILECFAHIYAETGDVTRSYDFYKQFHLAKEDVFNQEQHQKLSRLQIVFETEQAKKEAEYVRIRNEELAKANDALHEANQLKTELLGLAAHDLKNQLSAIRGFSEMIMASPDDASESLESATTINSSSNHMLRLIGNLLGNVAIETGKLELNKKPLDVGRLAAAVVKSNQSQAKQKSQTLLLIAKPHSMAIADDLRLREILDNLISNAIKYSNTKKKIWVRVKKVKSVKPATNGTWVRIEVQDKGQGLTNSDKQKLFGKFQRLSAMPTGSEHSSGLGLNIVKRLVDLHGGKVWAESGGIGKGTTFFVDLPTSD